MAQYIDHREKQRPYYELFPRQFVEKREAGGGLVHRELTEGRSEVALPFKRSET